MSVAVARVTERSVAETIETIGSIRPRRAIEVRPLASGRVASTGFESGQSVEAGATLLQLDAAAERAALAEAEADLRAAESDLARADELAEREVRSPATVEDAQAARDRSKARVAAAEAGLADRRVTAPFAGVIGLTDIDPGERVDAETVITTLDDLASVEVAFTLPERHHDAVAPGMGVRISRAVNSLFAERTAQTEATEAFLRGLPVGERVVLVTHQVNITALTGVYPSSGAIVVRRTGPDGFEANGSILIRP